MYSGQAVIDYLAVKVSKEDSGESSYWRKYHLYDGPIRHRLVTL